MKYFKCIGTDRSPSQTVKGSANYFVKDKNWVIQTEISMVGLEEITEAEASEITDGHFPYVPPKLPLGF